DPERPGGLRPAATPGELSRAPPSRKSESIRGRRKATERGGRACWRYSATVRAIRRRCNTTVTFLKHSIYVCVLYFQLRARSRPSTYVSHDRPPPSEPARGGPVPPSIPDAAGGGRNGDDRIEAGSQSAARRCRRGHLWPRRAARERPGRRRHVAGHRSDVPG